MLQAQCIVFSRYPEVLAPFKYAGYPMLLQAVRLPPENADGSDSPQHEHFLSAERTPRLQVTRLGRPLLKSATIVGLHLCLYPYQRFSAVLQVHIMGSCWLVLLH